MSRELTDAEFDAIIAELSPTYNNGHNKINQKQYNARYYRDHCEHIKTSKKKRNNNERIS